MESENLRLDHIVQKLKAHHHRITPQRLAILRILTHSSEHPTVEAVYERIKPDYPTTSLATVYKTISLAKELGEVLELEFSQGHNRYDGRKPQPHPHLICTRCQKILDPQAADIDDITRKIASETGFGIENHRLDFYGVCPQCQNEAAK